MLPKPIKRFLESLAVAELFVTPGNDQCLELHTRESLDGVHQRVQSTRNSAEHIRTFSRLFYAQAELCEIDGQHRIRIPKRLAQWAGLEKELAIVGVGSHWEIWNQSNWDQFFQSHRDNFEQVVATALDSALAAGGTSNVDGNVAASPDPNSNLDSGIAIQKVIPR